MTHNLERNEVPERIREIVIGRVPDEEGELAEWLAECSEIQFEAYLELTTAESPESETAKDPEDDEGETY